ncbi:MAG: NADH-quinone oxidoreductase subunit A [Nitrospirales bacterium]|nr:NADH-quinone oxidoreductase subunit A [Nitrospirales bacterium]
MNSPEAAGTALWPLLVYGIAVVALILFMLVLSYFLGQRHRERMTGEPYESGIAATGSARLRFDIKFYLVAMFFVIFDLEAVFIYAWAVSLRETGWAGYFEMLFFIGILLAALAYLWRVGALEWGTARRRLRGGAPGPDGNPAGNSNRRTA